MNDINDPGPGGYLLAWVASVVAYAAIFAVGTSVRDGTGLGTGLPVFVIYGCFIGAASIPFALLGVGLVHMVCRRVRAQTVHVLAAALVGLAPAVVMVRFDGSAGWWLWMLIPVATAIGRWSVVPLVFRARARARAISGSGGAPGSPGPPAPAR